MPPENINVSMDSSAGQIPAHSERQAMDWSLVLASQGIAATILRPPEGEARWLLMVEPAERVRALEAIRLYRVENRGWAWRRELPGAPLHFHFGAVLWCAALALFHYAATYAAPQMVTAGRMDSLAVKQGEWWRLFTAVTLHGDLGHLMANLTFGLVMLGLAMGRFGAGTGLLAAFLCGVAGNLAGLAFYAGPYKGLGASGMMMGALGLVAVYSFSMWKKSLKAFRYALSGLSGGIFLFLLFGVDPTSDVLAHLGGFLAGILLGGALSLLPSQGTAFKRWNAASLAVFVVSLFWFWGLALQWKLKG